jgi:hypothetical protein
LLLKEITVIQISLRYGIFPGGTIYCSIFCGLILQELKVRFIKTAKQR